ncbi:MAG: hypothetical protein EBZ51_12100 [Synechococcaceae bacterium WB9_2_112]|nr:hypothetical protein [Synechococcaceae bacterium WB9_2_112]
MATIRIDFDAEALQALDKRVRLLTDQNLRYVAARALTGAAQAAQAQLKQASPRYIDNPTRWTLNSTYVRFARADTLTAEVGFKADAQGRGNPAGKYLQPIVAGTTPKLKAADLSASKIARAPRGAVLIPAKGSGLVNAAGNVPLSKYATILAGARQGGGQYFIGPVKPGSSIKAVFERKEGFIGRTSTLERSTRRLFTLDPNPKPRRAQFPVRQVLEQGFASAWRREVAAAFDAEVARRLGGRR